MRLDLFAAAAAISGEMQVQNSRTKPSYFQTGAICRLLFAQRTKFAFG
jgi:hypothetical protein